MLRASQTRGSRDFSHRRDPKSAVSHVVSVLPLFHLDWNDRKQRLLVMNLSEHCGKGLAYLQPSPPSYKGEEIFSLGVRLGLRLPPLFLSGPSLRQYQVQSNCTPRHLIPVFQLGRRKSLKGRLTLSLKPASDPSPSAT